MEVRILSPQPQFVTKVKFPVLSTTYSEDHTTATPVLGITNNFHSIDMSLRLYY